MFKWTNDQGDFRPFRAAIDILLIIAFIAGLSTLFTGLSWGGQVVFAPVIGQGNARVTIESAPNRIGAQEMFVQMYADIQAYPGMIAAAQKKRDDFRTQNAGKSDPLGSIARDDSMNAAEVTGLVLNCQNAVKNYNAATSKISKEQFKDPNLPYTVNPNQYCREGD